MRHPCRWTWRKTRKHVRYPMAGLDMGGLGSTAVSTPECQRGDNNTSLTTAADMPNPRIGRSCLGNDSHAIHAQLLNYSTGTQTSTVYGGRSVELDSRNNRPCIRTDRLPDATSSFFKVDSRRKWNRPESPFMGAVEAFFRFRQSTKA